MKAEGIEYEERMALLEDVDYPKPLADLIEVAYEAYRKGAPWIAEYQPEPKSVIRDMYERAMTFSEYVAFYGLTRSEGVVLRYFADAYRAMRRTVPTVRPHRGADRHHLLARRTRPRRRFQPAGRVGGAGPSGRRRAGRSRPAPRSGRRWRPAASRPTSAASPSWSATRCSVGSSCVALRHYAELGELHGGQGWRADSWADAMAGYWDEYDDLGHRCRGPGRRRWS